MKPFVVASRSTGFPFTVAVELATRAGSAPGSFEAASGKVTVNVEF